MVFSLTIRRTQNESIATSGTEVQSAVMFQLYKHWIMKNEILNNLSTDEIAKGIELSLENAAELISDADLLLKERKFPRAYTLYQLAIEEIGKSRILFSLIMKLKLGEEVNYKELNSDFLFHQEKTKSSITFELTAILLMGSNTPKEDKEKRDALNEMIDDLAKERKNVGQLNDNKNNSLYVNVIDEKFISPKELITEKIAIAIKEKATIRFHASKPLLIGMLSNIDSICDDMKTHSIEESEIPEELIDLFSDK